MNLHDYPDTDSLYIETRHFSSYRSQHRWIALVALFFAGTSPACTDLSVADPPDAVGTLTRERIIQPLWVESCAPTPVAAPTAVSTPGKIHVLWDARKCPSGYIVRDYTVQVTTKSDGWTRAKSMNVRGSIVCRMSGVGNIGAGSCETSISEREFAPHPLHPATHLAIRVREENRGSSSSGPWSPTTFLEYPPTAAPSSCKAADAANGSLRMTASGYASIAALPGQPPPEMEVTWEIARDPAGCALAYTARHGPDSYEAEVTLQGAGWSGSTKAKGYCGIDQAAPNIHCGAILQRPYDADTKYALRLWWTDAGGERRKSGVRYLCRGREVSAAAVCLPG